MNAVVSRTFVSEEQYRTFIDLVAITTPEKFVYCFDDKFEIKQY